MSTTHPFSSTTTTTTTTTTPPPQPHIYPNIRPNPNSNQGILYPVASSGRGFIPKPMRPNSNSSDQTVTVANHLPYPPRPNQLLPRPHFAAHHHPIKPQFHHIPPPLRGFPPKVTASPPPVSDSNGYKNSKDKKDETTATIRDRKVRISDGASLYALCRSWLRNGFPEESQPRDGDGVKSLPRPLPMPIADTNVVKKREGEEEEEDDDEKDEVSHLSAQDLLKRHVKHARNVRARLREERAKRIERYKTRLSLLLPPLLEQSRNDGAGGN